MWRYSRKIERVCGRVFLIVFLLMLSASWIMPVLRGGKKDPFDLEGRLAEEIPAFDARSFLNGTFQDKLEKALSDQTIAGETLRVKYQGVKHKLFNQLSWISIRAGSGYRLVGNGLYTYDGHDYIVTNAAGNLMKSFEKNDAKIQESVGYYTSLPIPNKYQYIITTDSVIDFDNPNEKYAELMAERYTAFRQAALKIPDFETYMRYYAKNDHHWNYEGSYQGYKDIIRLILGDDEEPLAPVEKVVFNYDLKGSRSRSAPFMDFHENFTAYRFELKEHDTFMDGEVAIYGDQQKYFNNPDLRNGSGDFSYGTFYGPDIQVVEYDFKQPEKENLILIGYSDTNAINEIVASHFNRTWVIDPRFCSRSTFEKIISENEIQNLLLLPNASFIPIIPIEPKGYDS